MGPSTPVHSHRLTGIQIKHCRRKSYVYSGCALTNAGNRAHSCSSILHSLSVRSSRTTSIFGAYVLRPPPRRGVTDILAFAIIAYRIKKELPTRSLGITTLWNVILRDATLYFVVITFTQFFSLLFMFTTPVGGI